MISNYLKIAWRNLLKHKGFSLINILGLSIGIAACLIIFLYVEHELSFDQYNTKADRIARITTRLTTPDAPMLFGTSPALLADVLKKDFPEVEAAVRLEPAPKVMKLNNEMIREENFYSADQSVFTVFDFEFVEGTAPHALDQPQSMVITQGIAKKYFGSAPALGKTLNCDGKDWLVKGVVKDRPSNSDLKLDALMYVDYSKVTTWLDDFEDYTFVLFRQQPDLKLFNHKIESLGIKYAQAEMDAQDAKNYHLYFEAEPLKAVHFSEGKLVDTPKGNQQFNYLFSLLAVFILLIALLNYINLSTAKSTDRAREVGIRKVIGAGRFQLIRQFLMESVLLIVVAWIIALLLMKIALPLFNQLLQMQLSVNWWQAIAFMGSILFITLLLAGLYPAFVLSSFKPIKVLKGNWKHSSTGLLLRKSITFVQFAIAAGLILGTTVIYQQLRFIEHKDLGYNKNNLLNIYLPRDSAYMGAVKVFQQELTQRPEVTGVTIGSGISDQGMALASTTVYSAGEKKEIMCHYAAVDTSFIPLFQIQLLEGRNFSESFGTDKQGAFIVNEAFVKMMGWKTGLDQKMEAWGHKGKIIAVMKNFYYKSLHNVIEPLAIVMNTFPANTTTVKIQPKDIGIVKTIYKKHFPLLPFDYAFMDESVEKQYAKDRITMQLFNYFTILAVFISCLGLYGLVSLLSVQRVKEIGIRKVLGASLASLFSLQAKGYLQLVCWALAFALPVAGFAMNRWLTAYAYHIKLAWWMFLIPVLIIPLIALLVISREVIRVALVKPVISLKTE